MRNLQMIKSLKGRATDTVFPLIRAAPLGINIEISAFL